MAQRCLRLGALGTLLLIAASDAAAAAQPRKLSLNQAEVVRPNLQGPAAYDVSTIYRGRDLTSVVPYHTAMDPAVPGRIFASDKKASAIYFLDTETQGATWQLHAGTPHMPGWVDGPRGTALLSQPKGLCVGPKGHLFFMDHVTNGPTLYVVLRRVDAGTGEVTTVAGSTTKSGVEDGSGSAALFSTGSVELSCLADGQLLVNDMGGNGAIRRVTCTGEGCVAAAHAEPRLPGSDPVFKTEHDIIKDV